MGHHNLDDEFIRFSDTNVGIASRAAVGGEATVH